MTLRHCLVFALHERKVCEAGANVENPTGAGWNKSGNAIVRARRSPENFSENSRSAARVVKLGPAPVPRSRGG